MYREFFPASAEKAENFGKHIYRLEKWMAGMRKTLIIDGKCLYSPTVHSLQIIRHRQQRLHRLSGIHHGTQCQSRISEKTTAVGFQVRTVACLWLAFEKCKYVSSALLCISIFGMCESQLWERGERSSLCFSFF